MAFNIGPVEIKDPVFLAPMCGVSDMPFRRLVKGFGVGLVVSEMIASADNEEQYKQQLSDFCESVYELDYGRALELLDQLEILSKQATEE